MALSYPLDLSGIEPSNLITNELHSVQPPKNISNASFTVPLASPFFKEGFAIYTAPNKQGTKLVAGVDYMFTHKFVAGSNQTGRQLYGSVLWLNQNYTGTVYITYQTLGGDFTVNDVNSVEELTARTLRDIRFVTWDSITEIPSAFPSNAHEHPVTDIKTLADVERSVQNVANALLAQAGSSSGDSGAMTLLLNHLQAGSGAHTPAAVGLGSVPNYPMATDAEILQTRGDRFISPAGVNYLVRRLIANQNLDEVRGRITVLEEEAERFQQGINNLQLSFQQLSTQFQNISLTVDQYRQEIGDIKQSVELVQSQVQAALTGAGTAQIVAANTEANLQLVIDRVSDVLYAGTKTYPVGTFRIVLPPKNNLFVSLVGGGAGSGAYYKDIAEFIQQSVGAQNGGDSILWACGTASNPIEPFPIMIAGGGKVGLNNYIDRGAVVGGLGGSASRLGVRVNASTIKGKTVTDLVLGENSTRGTDGRAGDSGNTEAAVNGIGGYTIDTTGDLKTQVYGKGRAGTTRAGTGGSGSKINTIVANDLSEDYILVITVGQHGSSSRGLFKPQDVVTESNGVAYTTLVG